MKKILLFMILFTATLFAQEASPEVDCLILEDENSIICKYINERSPEDRTVTFEWIDPENKLSRARSMAIPAGHSSVYDFRYIEGRKKGVWTFKAIDGSNTFQTQFELK